MLEDIIQRCHKRHAERESLRQRKTVVTPALYKRHPFHVKVYCARGNSLMLAELENAEISFMPIGHAPENEHAPPDCGGDRFLKRQKTGYWRIRQWANSWGIQIYTGIPSERDGARWHDFEFKYEAICAEPEAVAKCIETLFNTHAHPLLTLTKSGGLRFSCRIKDYLHPNTDAERFFISKQYSTPDTPNHRVVLLEVLGNEGYSQWDMRYEILHGKLLEPPVIAKEILFASLHELREALRETELPQDDAQKTTDVQQNSIDSDNIELAKEAFLKRGYSYLGVDDGCYHWELRAEKGTVKYATLWEDQGIVWIRTSTPDSEIPIYAVPITDIWDDTGISPQNLVDHVIVSIREGNISPLTIKRPKPKLLQHKTAAKPYKSIQEQTLQLKQILKRDTRILALTTTEGGILQNTEAETELLNNHTTCLNLASRRLIDATADRYTEKDISSVVRWRHIMYRWDAVKDIPVDIRMANPFKHGNVCEDAERYNALLSKGGNPSGILCPTCPVYTACQERGYLSQPLKMQQATAQLLPIGKLFLEPRHKHLVQHLLDTADEERIYIIDERKSLIEDLFIECVIAKEVIEGWITNWQGYALGNFAVAIMNALETQVEPSINPITQVRAAVEAFKQYEDQIIQQMCYINIKGRVVERKTVDPETGAILSNFAIDIQKGSTVYIPLDTHAKEKLHAIGLPTKSPLAYSVDDDVSIPMQMEEAISLGVLDISTLEDIALFPAVCGDPEWTYWHQLTAFFEHYMRDADAPMRWYGQFLSFWLPPQLHLNIKRLLLITPFLIEPQLRRVFPNDDVDVIRVEPTAWLPDNKVFQIRSSSSSLNEILNDNNPVNTMELTKIGERYFRGIRTEIERDVSIKHAIITNSNIVKMLPELREKSNVCFIKSFKSLLSKEINFEPVQVLWIVGIPRGRHRDNWKHSQMLFGNDENPLYYGKEVWDDATNDARIQEVYHQKISGLLSLIVGRVGLNRCRGKTVLLLNKIELPDITDRPETILFDWVDFEIAGGLHKLEATVSTRESYEAERDNLTAHSDRKEVERILGCSSRQANRVLNKLRGGNIPRVSFREQILFLLSSGREKTTASLVAAIDSSPQAIGNELKRLLDEGEIVRVRRGVYALPQNM